MHCSEAVTIEAFPGVVAPCEHLVQIYEDEGTFMATLASFVGDGLQRGEGVVVVATASHLATLEAQLRTEGFNVPALRGRAAYLPLDAASLLSRFMVDGWPDEQLFLEAVKPQLDAARRGGRRVRAFGEMVGLLWAQGHNGATLRLEALWNQLCRRDGVAVFCAYPRIGAARELDGILDDVCALHTQVVATG